MGLYARVARIGSGTGMRKPRGLLSKAAALRPTAEDEAIEDAFILRMHRLPATDSTPFTALSLLKAFQPFSAGLCLTLREDLYECIAAVGVESAPASISRDVLFQPSESGPHRIGVAGDFHIASASPEAAAWVFPVSLTEQPHTTALILVEEAGKPLAADALARVIVACADHFKGKADRPAPAADNLKDFLSTALNDVSALHLIVIERQGVEDLARRASAAVATFGSAIELSAGRALIAVPTGHDRELLAHRLARSLSAVATAGTEVSSLNDAQEFLKTVV